MDIHEEKFANMAVSLPTELVEVLMDMGCAHELSITSKSFNSIFRELYASTPESRARYLMVHKRLMAHEIVPHLARVCTAPVQNAVDNNDKKRCLWKDVVPHLRAVRDVDEKTSGVVIRLLQDAAPLCIVALLRYLSRVKKQQYTIQNMARILHGIPEGAIVACLMADYIACDADFKKIQLTTTGSEYLQNIENVILSKMDERQKEKYANRPLKISTEIFIAYFVSHQRSQHSRSFHDILKYASFCDYDTMRRLHDDGIIQVTVEDGADDDGDDDDGDDGDEDEEEDYQKVKISAGPLLHRRLQFFQDALIRINRGSTSSARNHGDADPDIVCID
jgi:hypothetical protein